MRKLLVLLLLLGLPLVAQIPNPQVPFSGRIGPGGNFPLFNGGTLVMSADADRTMAFPEMTASVLRITSSVPLTATRNLIAPTAQFGYEFTIQNATTGGQSIVVKGTTGTGVTIPNGQAAMVMYDGTNYVSLGGAGGGAVVPGYHVPSAYSTTQSAVNAAGTGGAGPVVVAPNMTDTTAFTNPNNVRVDNYVQNGGIDSRFFRDASEWGVKGDGAIVTNCSTTAGSNVINCPTIANFLPGGSGFKPADVNKLIIAYAAGPPAGSVNPDVPITIVSGPTAAPNAYYYGVNTDTSSGCVTFDTQPHVWFHSDATGTIVQLGFNYAFYGEGCTGVPTTWTLANGPAGTVTTSGGAMFAEDQPTVITAVNSPTQITVADNMTVTSSTGIGIIYGTDDQLAWQAACNAMKDVSGDASHNYSHGTLTFHGTSLVSTGITCNGSNLWITGSGYVQLGESNTSILVYAGKAKLPDGAHNSYLFRLTGGQGARITRMGFRGNTMAQPLLLALAFGPANTPPVSASVGTGTTGVFEDLSFGWMYGDPVGVPRPAAPYSSQSCVFADTNVGNVDFNSFDRIYCRGAEVGVDGNNSQATGWRIGIWHSENNNIGYALGGGTYLFQYYTEHNKLDLMLGSPTHSAWFPVDSRFEYYDGESSSQLIKISPLQNQANLEMRSGGGNPAYIGPSGVAIDLGNMNSGSFKYKGVIPGKMILTKGCYGGYDIDIETSAPYASTVVWQNSGWSAACNNLTSTKFKWRFSGAGDASNSVQTEIDGFPGFTPSSTAITDIMGAQRVYGSIQAVPVTAPGDNSSGDGQNRYISLSAIGTGSTTYRYQVSCKDGMGRESMPNPAIMLVTNASPLNATTNFNTIQFQAHRGCAQYCFYGDEGSGGTIGQLACVEQTAIPGASWYDQGQNTPNTAITPPTVSQSGLIESAGLTILGQPFAGFKAPLVTTYYTQGQKLIGSRYLSDFSGKAAATGLVPIFDGRQYVPGSLVPPTAGVVSSLAGDVSQGGYTTIGNSTQSGAQIYTYVYYQAFTPTAAPPVQALQVVDAKLYIGSIAGGKIYAAIYDSDGTAATTGVTGAPGTLLCGDPTGTVPVINSWNTISSLDVTTCPYLTVGHKYFVATTSDGNVELHADGLANDGTSFYNTWVTALGCCWFRLNANYSEGTGAHYSQYVDLQTVPTFGVYNAANPIPASYLGTGPVGTGANCLADTQIWVPCSSGPGGGMVYPGSGVANSTGSAWTTSYSASNPIPGNFVAGTIGNAATASALAVSPNQCPAGQFATGINAAGNANCATPGSGSGPLYSKIVPNVSMIATAAVGMTLTGPECDQFSICTMVTPASLVDTGITYRIEFMVSLTAPGPGCSGGQGAIQVYYTDADSGAVINGQSLALRAMNSATQGLVFGMASAAPSTGTIFISNPSIIRALNGVPVRFRVLQSAVSTGCTGSPPAFTLRIALFGPLGY